MRPGVSNHGVLNPILPVEPAEDQSQSSVEQEATEQHKRRQSTEHGNRSRQVPRCEEQGAEDVCSHKDPLGYLVFAALSKKQLPDQEGRKGHEEQAEQHFLHNPAIENGGQPVIQPADEKSAVIAFRHLRQPPAEGPIVQ